jgi:hypothetical protein
MIKKLKFRWTCWWNDICPEHLTIKYRDYYGHLECYECYNKRQWDSFREKERQSKLESEKKLQKISQQYEIIEKLKNDE